MATHTEALEAIIDRIHNAATEGKPATVVLTLAEAYAWLSHPNQPHGGGSAGKGA